MSDLSFLGVHGERNHNEPVRHLLRLTTSSGRIRDVDLSITALAELARSAVVLLVAAIHERDNT